MVNYITEQDYQDYGGDLISFAQRAGAQASQQVLGPHLQQLEQSQAELQRRVAVEARHRLDSQVAAAVPNYREIDRSEEWRRWLCGVDPMNGQIRQRLLDAAIARGDSAACIAFFRNYLREQGSASPGHPSPHRAATRDVASAPSGRVFSRDDVSKIYAARRKGAYSDAAWQRLEAEVADALKNGRVVGRYPYLTK